MKISYGDIMSDIIASATGHFASVELFENRIVITYYDGHEYEDLNIPGKKTILLKDIEKVNYYVPQGAFSTGSIEFISNNPSEIQRKLELKSLMTEQSVQGSYNRYDGVPLENKINFTSLYTQSFSKVVEKLKEMGVPVNILLTEPFAKLLGPNAPNDDPFSR